MQLSRAWEVVERTLRVLPRDLMSPKVPPKALRKEGTAKKPGGVQPSHQAVADAIALCIRKGGIKWDGAVPTAHVGRHLSTDLALDRKIRA